MTKQTKPPKTVELLTENSVYTGNELTRKDLMVKCAQFVSYFADFRSELHGWIYVSFTQVSKESENGSYTDTR
jgi:hypothetical protein